MQRTKLTRSHTIRLIIIIAPKSDILATPYHTTQTAIVVSVFYAYYSVFVVLDTDSTAGAVILLVTTTTCEAKAKTEDID